MKILVSIFLLLCVFELRAENNQQEYVTIQTMSYPPYVIVNSDGEVRGLSVSIASEIFKAIGYKAKYNIVPYKRALRNLFSKNNAIMMGLFEGVPDYKTLNISEIKYTVFPTTYFYNHKKNPEYGKIKNIKQTKGKSVAVVRGTGIYEKAVTDAGGRLELVTNEIQTLKMLNANRVDFAHTGLLRGFESISNNPNYQNLRPLKFSVTKLISGMMFRSDANGIRDKFLKKAQEFHKNGMLLEIYKRALKNIPQSLAASMVPKEIKMNVNIVK